MTDRQAPGRIRDSIVECLSESEGPLALADIQSAVAEKVGQVSPSSIRSYLNLNTPDLFLRTGRGFYRLREDAPRGRGPDGEEQLEPHFQSGNASLYLGDSLKLLSYFAAQSVHAIVTDPPYGLVEYSAKEQGKLRSGRGGVWRIPPSFDGHLRSPLPRFTVLGDRDRDTLREFFVAAAVQMLRVTVPGANVVIASNPLLMHIVAGAMTAAGFESRGTIVRLVMTMRGGDRPKNAHLEYPEVSVMPRSGWEPWLVFRHPLTGRVQDNLREWKTGGFRRPSRDKPFCDVIKSSPTSAKERRLAAHPSLKPQAFLREVVRAVLPLGEGLILDPFAGSGSTLAAANAMGYASAGIELDSEYAALACRAIPRLAALN